MKGMNKNRKLFGERKGGFVTVIEGTLVLWSRKAMIHYRNGEITSFSGQEVPNKTK